MRCYVMTMASLLLACSVGTAEEKGGWISLFDGKSLKGWRKYNGKEPGRAWVAEDGVLHLKQRGGGTIISEQQFGDFELQLEWKVAKGSNSGIMYRVREGDRAPYFSGPEYQILDDANHRDGKNPKTSAGSLYALVAPEGKELKPVGEWNTCRIVLKGSHLEHWLNGKKVVEIEMHSPKWESLVKASKFAKWKPFGTVKKGHIAIQDHGDPVWFRSIRIRALK